MRREDAVLERKYPKSWCEELSVQTALYHGPACHILCVSFFVCYIPVPVCYTLFSPFPLYYPLSLHSLIQAHAVGGIQVP